MIVSPDNINELMLELIDKVKKQEPTCEADNRRKIVLLRKLKTKVTGGSVNEVE